MPGLGIGPAQGSPAGSPVSTPPDGAMECPPHGFSLNHSSECVPDFAEFLDLRLLGQDQDNNWSSSCYSSWAEAQLMYDAGPEILYDIISCSCYM